MKLAYVGTGYVGLVNGAVSAEMGNNVVCVDIDSARIEKLKMLEIPIYENGLEELVKKNVSAGRLSFTTDINFAVDSSDVLFTCVGTPSKQDGSADLSAVFGVAESIGRRIVEKNLDYRLLVNKSTVPVGTTDAVSDLLLKSVPKEKFDVAMNPEFLQEGKAVDNALRPDRIVIGVNSSRAEKLLRELYAPFVQNGHPIFVSTPREAELVKYAANTMLATRLGLINEIAKLCDAVGANVRAVMGAVTADRRIGKEFAHPGFGYGGSCFHKDVNALGDTAKKYGVDMPIAMTVDKSNERQKHVLLDKIALYFGDYVAGKTFSVWGLAFKAGTDDAREAPSLVIIDGLLKKGAFVRAYDPKAMGFVRDKTAIAQHPCFMFMGDEYSALKDSDALIVCTEWPQFKMPDFDRIKSSLRNPVVFDGKNLFVPEKLSELGFAYFGVGVENDVARSYRKNAGR